MDYPRFLPVNKWLKIGGNERLLIRIGVVFISLVAYYFAVFAETDIVSLLLGAYGGIAQLFPIMFALFYWPRANGKGALAGMIGGILVTSSFCIIQNLNHCLYMKESMD